MVLTTDQELTDREPSSELSMKNYSEKSTEELRELVERRRLVRELKRAEIWDRLRDYIRHKGRETRKGYDALVEALLRLLALALLVGAVWFVTLLIWSFLPASMAHAWHNPDKWGVFIGVICALGLGKYLGW
jgi:hypothetical protein